MAVDAMMVQGTCVSIFTQTNSINAHVAGTLFVLGALGTGNAQTNSVLACMVAGALIIFRTSGSGRSYTPIFLLTELFACFFFTTFYAGIVTTRFQFLASGWRSCCFASSGTINDVTTNGSSSRKRQFLGFGKQALRGSS
jgi:hypothetical protein